VQPFKFIRATDAQQATSAAAAADTHFLAGGTNLVDLMKAGVEQPRRLVDISALPLSSIETLPGGGVRLGALARNSDAANHPLVRAGYPLLAQALLAGASPQLRNMATTGGNLMQRTRCYYFVDTSFPACNKRSPGSGCGARDGYNRIHAIFGASDACVATNPSDMNVALVALDALVQVQGSRGVRSIPVGAFHRLPGQAPQRDTELRAGELIVAVDLPASTFANHSAYLKVRDRESYAFALVSAAVGLDLEGQRVRDCRIVLGGVAHKPWRATQAEAVLRGAPLDESRLIAAADACAEGARPLRYNAFKVALTRNTVARALRTAAGLA
jgi:xanthine dehydrogenase YagS FAD-binding subunit